MFFSSREDYFFSPSTRIGADPLDSIREWNIERLGFNLYSWGKSSGVSDESQGICPSFSSRLWIPMWVSSALWISQKPYLEFQPPHVHLVQPLGSMTPHHSALDICLGKQKLPKGSTSLFLVYFSLTPAFLCCVLISNSLLLLFLCCLSSCTWREDWFVTNHSITVRNGYPLLLSTLYIYVLLSNNTVFMNFFYTVCKGK